VHLEHWVSGWKIGSDGLIGIPEPLPCLIVALSHVSAFDGLTRLSGGPEADPQGLVLAPASHPTFGWFDMCALRLGEFRLGWFRLSLGQ
jgi:hypothetical protein